MTPIPAETQSRAADEIDALPEDSAIREVLRASALDRRLMRACLAEA